jgi:hypothetical protein
MDLGHQKLVPGGASQQRKRGTAVEQSGARPLAEQAARELRTRQASGPLSTDNSAVARRAKKPQQHLGRQHPARSSLRRAAP